MGYVRRDHAAACLQGVRKAPPDRARYHNPCRPRAFIRQAFLYLISLYICCTWLVAASVTANILKPNPALYRRLRFDPMVAGVTAQQLTTTNKENKGDSLLLIKRPKMVRVSRPHFSFNHHELKVATGQSPTESVRVSRG